MKLGWVVSTDSPDYCCKEPPLLTICYETHKISNLPLDVKGYMLPPEPKLYHSPIVSQILLNYIKIEDTTQTKRGQGWLGLK